LKDCTNKDVKVEIKNAKLKAWFESGRRSLQNKVRSLIMLWNVTETLSLKVENVLKNLMPTSI
jgi:hypothetical protein